MRVHVVYRDPDEDSVLGRLARALAAASGWTLSPEPDVDADWNVFGSYLDLAARFGGWRGTRVAAYFSHREADTPQKEHAWMFTRDEVDLRIVTAPMYKRELSEFGPTALCRPPVDPQFSPRARVRHEKALVGLAGFVRPPSTRKGEALVRELGRMGVADLVKLTATGSGWPVPCHMRPWSELPRWYGNLDAFLCVAGVEGVPMPPLECLAMGVPVIVPRGVGMLDLLPGDVPGIWRYEAGDAGDLFKVLRRFASAPRPPNPERLRACVDGYTAQGWAEDHMAALQLFDAAGAEPEPVDVVDASARPVDVSASASTLPPVARAPARGMFMVAYGEPARAGAARAVAAFRRHMPADVQMAVASDSPVEGADVHVPAEDADVGGRSVKTRMYDLAPAEWDQVLYMDADTEVTKPDAAWLFRPLDDGWDVVVCTNPGKFHVARRMRRPDNEDECLATFAVTGTEEILQLNGGVMAFRRNERTHAFFEAWHAEWQRWGKRDQAALLRALWRCPVRLFVVGNQFNCVLPYCPADPAWNAGVMHHVVSVRRWTGTIEGRSDSSEAWGRVEQFKGRGGVCADYKRR